MRFWDVQKAYRKSTSHSFDLDGFAMLPAMPRLLGYARGVQPRYM
jgi:hypothetical protein